MEKVLIAIEEFGKYSEKPINKIKESGFELIINETGLPLDLGFYFRIWCTVGVLYGN